MNTFQWQGAEPNRISDKSYMTAVILSAIFSVLGLHHFYLGRALMGCLDLGITLLAICLMFLGAAPLGALLLFLDFVHGLYCTYQLFVGKYRDGAGALVCYPGQFPTALPSE